MRPLLKPTLLATTVAIFNLACSGSDSGTASSSVGGTGTGGASSSATGGSKATINASGGVVGIGGTVNSSGGATPGSGGVTAGGSASATGGTAAGGVSSNGGATGGTPATTGGAKAGGAPNSGGSVPVGGSVTGGVTTTGGAKATGGVTTTGGAKATGGVTTTGGASATGGAGVAGGSSCGATPNPIPFNCRFAWGLNAVNPSSYPYIQFISNWAGWDIKTDGTFSSCDQCNWLKNTMANATQVPVLIAYFIGYWGHAMGLPDGNVNPNGPNLTNGMGTLLLGTANAACPSGVICENNLMVKAYAWYAAQVYAVFKKPIIWWLEGDFIQYSPEGAQTQPLTYDQTGQLAAQITRAIKCNDPAAVVAWNYSTWVSTSERDQYFNAINANVTKLGTSWEMVWTSGKGNTATAGTGTTWAQLYAAAGNKVVMSDESFGLSVAGDTWANQTAATINARIAQHVVGADITTSTVPTYLQTNFTTTLAPNALDTTCF